MLFIGNNKMFIDENGNGFFGTSMLFLTKLLIYAFFGPMVDEHKELVFNRESEHCVFPLDFNGRVPGGPSARFSVS